MRLTPLISLGASIVLGAGAIFIGRMYVSTETPAVQADALAQTQLMASVLVAAARIEAGELVERGSFRTAEWPANLAPNGALEDFPEGETRIYARNLILPGEPIFSDKLDMSGVAITLAAAIPPGMRAISVEVKIDSGVSGFVLPGDRVDVNEFVEKKSRSGSGSDPRIDEFIARRVVENVKVLAVDQSFESGLEGAKPSRTVTLEVTPDQALEIGVANERGALGLALIGREETIAGPPARKEPAPEPAPKVRRATYTPRAPTTTRVRVINGEQETEIVAPVSKPRASQPTNLLDPAQ